MHQQKLGVKDGFLEWAREPVGFRTKMKNHLRYRIFLFWSNGSTVNLHRHLRFKNCHWKTDFQKCKKFSKKNRFSIVEIVILAWTSGKLFSQEIF